MVSANVLNNELLLIKQLILAIMTASTAILGFERKLAITTELFIYTCIYSCTIATRISDGDINVHQFISKLKLKREIYLVKLYKHSGFSIKFEGGGESTGIDGEVADISHFICII